MRVFLLVVTLVSGATSKSAGTVIYARGRVGPAG